MTNISSTNGERNQSQHPPRISKACTQCRRRKIKCDGAYPCAHCARLRLECLYQVRRKRRQKPKLAVNMNELTSRLQTLEDILKGDRNESMESRMDSFKADQDMNFDGPESNESSPASLSSRDGTEKPPENTEAITNGTEKLDIDREGKSDYYGTSSEIVFLQQLEDFFGPRFNGITQRKSLTSRISIPSLFETKPSIEGIKQQLQSKILPPRRIADELINSALDEACTLEPIVHRPTFDRLYKRVFTIPPGEFGLEEESFLPLLYAVCAVGSLFNSHILERMDYECAILEGSKYFNWARQLIDLADCRNIISLQAVVFLNKFLQCTARISRCYSYLGITVTLALRMGLHRSLRTCVNNVEREERCRIFWAIHNMDVRISSLMGLPRLLHEDEIDQCMPSEVMSHLFANQETRLPSPYYSKAGASLDQIMSKISRYIYPVKHGKKGGSGKHLVSYTKMLQMENEIDKWKSESNYGLQENEDMEKNDRAYYLLCLHCAHVQLLLYRPFLHYISKRAEQTDSRAKRLAMSCIAMSRETIHIGLEMNSRDLLLGAYWFEFYTIFSAILALVVPIMDRNHDLDISELLQDAKAGREILTQLSSSCMAADRCSQMLASIFERADNSSLEISDQRKTPGRNTSAKEMSELGERFQFCRQGVPDPTRRDPIVANNQHIQTTDTGPTAVGLGGQRIPYAFPLQSQAETSLHCQSSMPRLGVNERLTDQNSPGDLIHVEQFRFLPQYAISLPHLSSYSQTESTQPPAAAQENGFPADWAGMGYSPNSLNLVDMITIDGWHNITSNLPGDPI
ncbi:fungal-specific transcription factor domain-containing protein [Xylogone sp. PMI_703]|nr:fungal-specific transcription factor domain-containing protein [Xylogone sp. PMI_703]